MDAEAMREVRARRALAKRRRRAGLTRAGLALALGCFTQKPSGEGAPSAPATPTPAPQPEAPAEVAPAPPLPRSEPSVEQKGETPASGKGAVSGSPAAAPPRTSTSAQPAPAKPAAKARSAAGHEGAAESDRAIGGNADDAERDAPALRQRLDRAYRAGSPDCPSARERKKAVCDLAAQICQLTDRDPNVASVAEYCTEAKQRCSQAEQRTQERCPG
jgi:hypothetical protein